MTRIVIIGGGPGGYEAALVAAQHGASVTVVDRDGIGGSAVLTDCVPSKALIAVAAVLTTVADSGALGVTIAGRPASTEHLSVDLASVNSRVVKLAQAQSRDTRVKLERAGVHLVAGVGRLEGRGTGSFRVRIEMPPRYWSEPSPGAESRSCPTVGRRGSNVPSTESWWYWLTGGGSRAVIACWRSARFPTLTTSVSKTQEFLLVRAASSQSTESRAHPFRRSTQPVIALEC